MTEQPLKIDSMRLLAAVVKTSGPFVIGKDLLENTLNDEALGSLVLYGEVLADGAEVIHIGVEDDDNTTD